jgi:sugar lactone lactonase YvrE
VAAPQTLMTGIAFGESPRWHQDRLWFSDWGAGEVIALGIDGEHEVMASLGRPAFPMCIDFLDDGRLLVVDAASRKILRREEDGSLVEHADTSSFAPRGNNEIVVDACGNIFLNEAGFDFPGGEFKPGSIGVVRPDGSGERVGERLAFPNGMAIAADETTLICAESYAGKLTAFDIAEDGTLSNQRTWADTGEGSAPDGICIDAEGAVWYGSVPQKRCRRVAEGGEVLETIELEHGCFACMLGGPEGTTLFMVGQEWNGPEAMAGGERTGEVQTAEAPAPHAGRP